MYVSCKDTSWARRLLRHLLDKCTHVCSVVVLSKSKKKRYPMGTSVIFNFLFCFDISVNKGLHQLRHGPCQARLVFAPVPATWRYSSEQRVVPVRIREIHSIGTQYTSMIYYPQTLPSDPLLIDVCYICNAGNKKKK
jgi:hypothetical protein